MSHGPRLSVSALEQEQGMIAEQVQAAAYEVDSIVSRQALVATQQSLPAAPSCHSCRQLRAWPLSQALLLTCVVFSLLLVLLLLIFTHHLPDYQLRFPSWGTGGNLTDLTIAYEKAAAVVLAAKPQALIFAQGVLAGRDLRGVRQRPLVLRSSYPLGQVVSNQLVYEVHEYPFLW
jgi:multisubunit Na+/H+ antiporter MnhC subunit